MGQEMPKKSKQDQIEDKIARLEKRIEKLEPDKDLEEMRELIRKDEKEREKEIIYVPYPVPTPQPYYPRYPWVTYTGMGTAVKLGEEQPSSQYE